MELRIKALEERQKEQASALEEMEKRWIREVDELTNRISQLETNPNEE